MTSLSLALFLFLYIYIILYPIFIHIVFFLFGLPYCKTVLFSTQNRFYFSSHRVQHRLEQAWLTTLPDCKAIGQCCQHLPATMCLRVCINRWDVCSITDYCKLKKRVVECFIWKKLSCKYVALYIVKNIKYFIICVCVCSAFFQFFCFLIFLPILLFILHSIVFTVAHLVCIFYVYSVSIFMSSYMPVV